MNVKILKLICEDGEERTSAYKTLAISTYKIHLKHVDDFLIHRFAVSDYKRYIKIFSGMTKTEDIRKVDVLFAWYEAKRPRPTWIDWICIPLMIFGLIGLVTAVLFPQLDFLGKYNMFINWFSFVLAAVIYYYLRISPMLSYLMLFFFGFCYMFIVQLEYVERDGGPALWQVSLVIFGLAWLVRLIANQTAGKGFSFSDDLKSILVAPIWLWHIILKALKVRY